MAREMNPHPLILRFNGFADEAICYSENTQNLKVAILDMQYVCGFTLYDLVSLQNPDINEARVFFIQILQALNHLHNVNKYAHRDLKLENIMIERSTADVKIIDFGFAT